MSNENQFPTFVANKNIIIAFFCVYLRMMGLSILKTYKGLWLIKSNQRYFGFPCLIEAAWQVYNVILQFRVTFIEFDLWCSKHILHYTILWNSFCMDSLHTKHWVGNSLRKNFQLADHCSELKMCHRSIPHVLCPIYFASVSQLLQLQRQQEMPLLLRNFATKRIGPYIKPVCDFHHLLSTQSAWRYQNWLNSMTQKCTKKMHPF